MQILPISTGLAAAQIGEIAERRLRESPYFYLKGIRCQFQDGVLTLRGSVPYRQLRQFAESIVWRVEGVQEIVNRVEVRDPLLGPSGAPWARSAG